MILSSRKTVFTFIIFLGFFVFSANGVAGGHSSPVPKFINEGTPALSWNTFLGSSSLDYGYSIAVDSSGNAYVVGVSDATWGTPINSFSGQYDAFVAKLSSSGVLQWNTFLGSIYHDYGYALAIDSSGNVYVTGTSRATWGSPLNAFTGDPGMNEAFVAKLSSSGVLQWNTFLGSSNLDFGYSIDVDGSGNVYVAGDSWATWGTPVNPHSVGNYDAFAAKLSNSGVLQWNTFLGGSNSDRGYITVDGSGNIYASGHSYASWGTPVIAFSGNSDVYVAKLSGSGGLEWNTFLGSSDQDYGKAAVDGSGNIYAFGQSKATWGTPVHAHTGDYDAFAAKLTNSGGLQWNTFIGSSDSDDGDSLAFYGSDTIYVGGVSASTWGSPVNPHAGGYGTDAFVAKLSSSGALDWNTFMGSTSWEYNCMIDIDADESIYAAGRSMGTWGSPILPYSGGEDAYAAKLLPEGIPQSLTVTSPNGSESWQCGTSHDITWTQSGISGDVTIDLYKTGSFDSNIGSASAAAESFSWNIPVSQDTGDDYTVKIYNASVDDTSDGYFSITAVCDPPIITQQPLNIMINYNTSTSLTVDASSATACHYQWYQGESGNTAVPVGTDASTFMTPALTSTTSYWVKVSNSCGSVDSNTAVVSVLPLTFLTDLEEVAVPEGGTADFEVKLTAEPLADVSVTVSRVSGDSDINVSAGSGLTFTTVNWDIYQTVTLSADLDGDILNGQATIRMSASEPEDKNITAVEQEREERIPSAYQVIPEVMWAPASGGGTWLTEVFITDLTGGTEVSATFNGISGDRRGPFTVFTGAAPDSCIKINNLLDTLDQIDSGFSYYGTIGAVEFSTQDENHKIHVIARTKNGHYSKTFQGLNFNDNNLAGGSRVMMIQNLSANNSFRSAYGAFNPTEEPVSIEYRIMDKNGNTIGNAFTKDFLSKQFSAFAPFVEADVTGMISNAWLKITPVSGNGGILSYGATVNNYTNDPAVHIAVQSEDIGGYNSPENYQVIPEVMWARASGGGEWKTEIFITDVTGGSEVFLTYDTFTGTRRGPISLGTFTSQFKSGSVANILAVLDYLDSGFDYYGTAGTLEFTTQDENHKIQTIARTYNGNYSKTFQGISFNNANTASTERSLMVQNLVSNDTFRSAFGAFNASGESAEVRFTILDEDCSLVGSSFTKTFTGYQFHAFNPFAEAGVPYPSYQYDATWVKVEVISGSGQIMAFGSTSNNFTNDPAVHRGVLR